MESEESVIAARLKALRSELAVKEREDRESAERYAARARNADAPYDAQPHAPSFPPIDFERSEQMRTLRAQIALLEELKGQLEAQHSETKAHFLAIEKRDARSSSQGIWLTIISSAISLILGWLLSLLGSPATLVHALGR